MKYSSEDFVTYLGEHAIRYLLKTAGHEGELSHGEYFRHQYCPDTS